MADAAAARREARRKRILENSHNRLQLISGKCTDESFRDSTNTSPIPQVFETFISDSASSDVGVTNKYTLVNGGIGVETRPHESLSSKHDVVDSVDGEVVNDLAAVGAPAPEQIQIPLWKTALNYKYDIILLSILLQILHGLFQISYENTYFFLPLIIYGLTKTFLLPKQNNSGIANALLLLNGMTPNRLHTLIQILQWFATLGQDVSIFLFTTICIQSLFTLFKESFVT